MLGHIRNNDEQGDVICMEVEALQMIAGMEAPMMEESPDIKWRRWVEDTWVKDVKIFFEYNQGRN